MRQSNSSAIQPEITSFGANRGKMGGGGGHVQEDILIERKKDVVLVQAVI